MRIRKGVDRGPVLDQFWTPAVSRDKKMQDEAIRNIRKALVADGPHLYGVIINNDRPFICVVGSNGKRSEFIANYICSLHNREAQRWAGLFWLFDMVLCCGIPRSKTTEFELAG
jgi:hypothetical protein